MKKKKPSRKALKGRSQKNAGNAGKEKKRSKVKSSKIIKLKEMLFGEKKKKVKNIKVTVFSDYTSPYCFVAFDFLKKMRDELNLKLEFKCFELRREGSAKLSKHSPYHFMLEKDVKNIISTYGINVVVNDYMSYSRKAHILGKFFEEKELLEDYSERVFKAYHFLGKNIENAANLMAIAKPLGYSYGTLEKAISSRNLEEKVVKDENEAKKLGIRGVPAIVVGKKIVEGIWPYETFKKNIEQLIKEL